LFHSWPATAGSAVGKPERITTPDAERVVAVTEPVTVPINPAVEVTGPEKVVEAMVNSLYMQYFVL
jgi:hypothetical protein